MRIWLVIPKKISVSLPKELLRYAEQYAAVQRLASRSEVLSEAIRALRERELARGYRELAEEYLVDPDPLLDSDLADRIEPGSEENW
jgi:Arc/MetJ-type ribon-helix-helix transcriptional regulator